jgi:hypothetical protein
MNDPLPQRESVAKKLTGLFTIFDWLFNFIQLKEEERDAAGIYFGRPDNNDYEP